jgi:hypothetical protein
LWQEVLLGKNAEWERQRQQERNGWRLDSGVPVPGFGVWDA